MRAYLWVQVQVEINNVDHAHATTFDVISFEESRAHAREQNNR